MLHPLSFPLSFLFFSARIQLTCILLIKIRFPDFYSRTPNYPYHTHFSLFLPLSLSQCPDPESHTAGKRRKDRV
ncbi:hypothetical protein F5Y07DRAFT_376019 [Xylaria sp. FL0933]|nr:hypothetical protein F5Y07DRAFT_376019 [Xylaria sp. FL0933]